MFHRLLYITISCYLVLKASALKEATDRVFTAKELSKYNGEDKGEPIYLSVLGEVYDVTIGDEFYAVGNGYSFFAGRDATICFFTGEYNEKHLNSKKVTEFDGKEIYAMDEWRKFYEKHEEYEFLGVLEGDYYDSKGKETSYLLEIKETVESARIIALEEEAKRKEEQLKRRATRLARAREKEAQEEAAEF